MDELLGGHAELRIELVPEEAFGRRDEALAVLQTGDVPVLVGPFIHVEGRDVAEIHPHGVEDARHLSVCRIGVRQDEDTAPPLDLCAHDLADHVGDHHRVESRIGHDADANPGIVVVEELLPGQRVHAVDRVPVPERDEVRGGESFIERHRCHHAFRHRRDPRGVRVPPPRDALRHSLPGGNCPARTRPPRGQRG